MNERSELDQARVAALGRIEQAERMYKYGIVLVALFEGLLGIAFLSLMDFQERSHWLLLLGAILVYGIVLISVVNLGRYINAATHTILQAIFAQRTQEGNP